MLFVRFVQASNIPAAGRLFAAILRLIPVLLLLLCLMPTPVTAQEKDTFSSNLRANRYALEALIWDKLVETDISPQWWQRLNDSSQTEQYSAATAVRCLLSGMHIFAKSMEWGDLREINYRGGNDGSSPLLAETVDSWKPKLGLKLILKDEPKSSEGIKTTVNNIDYLSSPLMNDYYCKPRSGKLFLKIQLDSKLSAAKYGWDNSKTTFTVLMPAYSSVSQGDMQEALKLGK